MGSLGPSVARLPLACKLRLDFPTTRNPTTDSDVRQHLRWACEYIIQYLGPGSIHSIVLSGSLAVGEGSAFLDVDGEVKLLSDLDIHIVAKEDSWPHIEAESTRARFRTKNTELNLALNTAAPPGFLNPIDTAIVTREQILSWWKTPRIVTLQLGGTARVLWGDDALLPAYQPVSAGEIADDDVFKLLDNRIAEQVFYFVRYKRGLDGPECFVYHSAKAGVDTVLAVCAGARRDIAGLLDRLEIFEDLCRDPLLGPDMPEWASFWTTYRMAPDLGTVVERFKAQNVDVAALAAWDEAAEFLPRALRWSARTRLGIDDEDTGSLAIRLARHFGLPRPRRLSLRSLILHGSRFLALGRKDCASQEFFADQLRAHNLPVLPPRRIKELSALGSPRSLTYATATLLLSARGKPETEQDHLLQTASRVLPLGEPPVKGDVAEWWWDLAIEAARLWNMLVMGGRR